MEMPPLVLTTTSSDFEMQNKNDEQGSDNSQTINNIRIYHCSHHNLSILQKQHIINPHLTVTPQIAHHIPMQCRLVHSTCFWIAGTKRQVDRTTHLLIEKCIFDCTIHPRIITK